MIFTDEELKTTFEVPDSPNGRVLLAFDAKIEDPTGGSMYERLWSGLCAVASKWESEVLPKMEPGVLDEPLTAEQLQVVKWAGLAVFSWARAFKIVEKK